MIRLFVVLFLFLNLFANSSKAQNPMLFKDTSRVGVPYAKDPFVLRFKGLYWLYYSIPPALDGSVGWSIGIALSEDLQKWSKAGEIRATQEKEGKGICAPSLLILENKVHIFYQSYGDFGKEAICHATSEDGIHFDKDPGNPVFKAEGAWNCGRAIDAEIISMDEQYYLYFATRDPKMEVQSVGLATTLFGANFEWGSWEMLSDESILKPEESWEKKCIEAPSIINRNNQYYMFYAGGYNNEPQQIGVAKSRDGKIWKKISSEPFLKNGMPGSWNESESGHPCIFEDVDGRTYLFYQGNDDRGKSWYISYREVVWKKSGPVLKNIN